MATVFLNGRFVAQDEARLSAFDAGVQHGVGLFETMVGGASGGRAGNGDAAPPRAWVFRLEEHLERLIGSARDLGLSDELRAPGLAEAVLRTVEKSGLGRARVRLTVTGGDLNLLARGTGARGAAGTPGPAAPARVQPTIMIVTHDMGEAFALADCVGVVDEGALVAFARPDDIRSSGDPRIRRLLDSMAVGRPS